MISAPFRKPAGFSIVGMLVTMVCIVVLFAILMKSLNKSVTGQGSQQGGTVRSVQDEMNLYSIYQSMAAFANENKGLYPVPSKISGSNDPAENTSANLWSVMLMNDLVGEPKQLISGNEYSGYVEEMRNYNKAAYNPSGRVFWDTNFKADLNKLSHVSFAHEPLCGKRFDNEWNNRMSSAFPLIGNRGPKDGVSSTNSWACGRNGVWGGHLVFGDGHIVFTKDPMGNGLAYEQDGQRFPDNLFKMESGALGSDAIFSFTRSMSRSGPELQFD